MKSRKRRDKNWRTALLGLPNRDLVYVECILEALEDKPWPPMPLEYQKGSENQWKVGKASEEGVEIEGLFF